MLIRMPGACLAVRGGLRFPRGAPDGPVDSAPNRLAHSPAPENSHWARSPLSRAGGVGIPRRTGGLSPDSQSPGCQCGIPKRRMKLLHALFRLTLQSNEQRYGLPGSMPDGAKSITNKKYFDYCHLPDYGGLTARWFSGKDADRGRSITDEDER